MGESVEFKVKLDDEVSKPARRGAAAVEDFADSVDHLRKGFMGADGRMRDAKGRFVAMRRAMGDTSTTAQGLTSRFGSMIGNVVSVGAVVMVATQALRALGRAALVAGAAIAEAAMFAEDMEFGLSKFLGSAKEGKREMAKLLDVSDQLGISFRDAAGTFKMMISAGMVADAAHEMVKFRADMEALAQTDQDIEKLNNAFLQIEKAIATGRLEMDGFTSILAGIPRATEETILAKLAPMLGKTVEELKKMDKTKLPVDKLMEAIKLAFLEGVGEVELGKVAIKKALETVSGAFTALKKIAGNALIRLGAIVMAELKDTLLPVFVELRDALTSKDGVAALKALAKALAAMVKIGVAFGKGLMKGFKVALPGIKALASAIGKLLGTSEGLSAMEMVFEAIGWTIGVVAGALTGFVATLVLVAAGFAAVAGAVTSVVGWFQALPSTIANMKAEFLAGGGSLGSAIITGIISGLTGGVGGVIIAIGSLVAKMVAAGHGALGASASSKVFETLFGSVPEGAERGIERGAPAVSSAAAGTIDPAKMAGVGGTTNNV
jgi:tape measure domain-containing protein